MPSTSIPLTLPAKYYTDPALFRAEMERFYFGRWIYAGRAEQLTAPGAYFLCEVGGESIIVTGQGAFYNVCRHRGTRMCTAPEGVFAGSIQCPYHGWSYALDGSLISAPNMGHAGFSRFDYPLHKVACDTWDGHVFLNLSTHAKPLASQLGDLPARFAAWNMGQLKRYKRIVYDVKTNWKLIVQNYNECLHCPTVHPALDCLTDYLGADNQSPTPDYIGGSMGFRDGVETMTFDGIRRREYLPGLNAEQRGMVCYYAIYPNFLLALHPDYMLTHALWPKAVDRTEIVCEWHFHPQEMQKPDFQGQDAVDFWDQINREDWGISELSQLGIGSRAYTPGPYSKREELLRAFDQIIEQ